MTVDLKLLRLPYNSGATQKLLFNKLFIKVKRCQEQIFKNYWMQVSILVT